MKKTYGVCVGILALGLVTVGSPSGKAQSQKEAGGSGGVTVENAPVAAGSSTAAPADLDRRIEVLEQELASLRTEMIERKRAEEATPAAKPQDAAAAAAPTDKPAEKTTIASLLGPTSVSGFVDGYYSHNFNHPSNTVGGACESFHVFDFRCKSISLNMVELTVDKAPDASGPAGRTGYHVSLGYGDAMNVVNAADPAGLGFAQYLKEAYFSYLAPVGKGLQFDFGKFVTPMGAEVIESKDNWNYSRGLLFGYAIPFYHFGVRAKYTVNDKAAVTGFLVNGWNNVVDNNTGKTYGFSLALTPTKKWTITPTYLAGPEGVNTNFSDNVGNTITNNTNDNWRQVIDLVVGYNPSGKLSFLVNGDYGRGDRTFAPIFTFNPPLGQNVLTGETTSSVKTWYGAAFFAKYAFDDKNYVAGRYEYYEDHDGFTTGTGLSRLHFNEFTATYQHTIATHLLTRFEYRRDMANFPVYTLSGFSNGVKQQSTATIGLILLFDSRDAK